MTQALGQVKRFLKKDWNFSDSWFSILYSSKHIVAVKFDVSHFSTYCQESLQARQFRVPGLFIAQISFTTTTQISFS